MQNHNAKQRYIQNPKYEGNKQNWVTTRNYLSWGESSGSKDWMRCMSLLIVYRASEIPAAPQSPEKPALDTVHATAQNMAAALQRAIVFHKAESCRGIPYHPRNMLSKNKAADNSIDATMLLHEEQDVKGLCLWAIMAVASESSSLALNGGEGGVRACVHAWVCVCAARQPYLQSALQRLAPVATLGLLQQPCQTP